MSVRNADGVGRRHRCVVALLTNAHRFIKAKHTQSHLAITTLLAEDQAAAATVMSAARNRELLGARIALGRLQRKPPG